MGRSFAFLVVLAGCANPALDDRPVLIHARFDPDAKSIPMPNDAARDAVAGTLDLPNDTDKERARLTPAESEFYAYLETLDGWSSLMTATVDFTGAIDPATVNQQTIQVWHWNDQPAQVLDVRVTVAEDGRKLYLDPPRTGWVRGDRYAVVLRGGADGVVGKQGERVECDAAFYFLKQTEALDTPEHERAFPGDTKEERQRNARKLETIRKDIAPMFEHFEARGLPRDEVAALWAFTVTTRTELAMDKASQRMPLPIELMIDPDTKHVDLPLAPWDSPMEAEVKTRLRELTGFGLSSDLMFELTAPVDATTLDATSVHLFKLDPAPSEIEIIVTLMPDHQHVLIAPAAQRLLEDTRYAVVVDDSVRDVEGRPLVTMPAGHFLKARSEVYDGASLVSGVDTIDAHKLEVARAGLAADLDRLGRDNVLAVWPFKTMPVRAGLVEARKQSGTLGLSPDPHDVEHLTPGEAIVDFPLAVLSTSNLADVYHGTIESPYFLDRQTRALRPDGGHVVEDVAFTMAVPKNPKPGPIPVVIFGHGLVTERRFVLAVANALAAKGFASISIDFPFHGKRTACATGGPISVVNPSTGEIQSLDPCKSGTTCNKEGRCVDDSGNGGYDNLAKFPIIDLPVASGAVFNEVDHIASSKDHFWQALVDLGSLDRSLREGAWLPLLGRAVDTTRIYYTGQSLGGIMGAIFLGTSPAIDRAVLNVPGADLIRMFDGSDFFHPQMNGLFTREHVDRESFEGKRLLAVAGWVMDVVDPQHLGEATGARELLIQMALLDFIIPNESTKELEAVTGAQRRDYVAEHGFITIPVEPEYFRGCSDMAKFLNGEGL
jgi:hypothetical protein